MSVLFEQPFELLRVRSKPVRLSDKMGKFRGTNNEAPTFNPANKNDIIGADCLLGVE